MRHEPRRPRLRFARRVLWVSGAVDVVAGIFLLAFPENIIALAGLPIAFHSIYLALAGAAVLGYGFAKVREANSRINPSPLLGAIVITHAVGVVALVLWAWSGRLALPAHGWVTYWLLAVYGVAITAAALLALFRQGVSSLGDNPAPLP